MIKIENISQLLVVDDSGTARMIIKQCLEIIGFQGKSFLEAGNGRDALEILNQKTVDIVVTDLNMPVMDGHALLQAIKADGKLKRLPVIVITSSSNDAREKILLEQGAAAVINKPLNPMALAQAWKLVSGGM